MKLPGPGLIGKDRVLLTLKRRCLEEWVDFNGHMRDAYYVLLISFANDLTMDELGMGPSYLKRTGCTLYNLDTHIRYFKEAHLGELLRVEMLLFDADEKRLHLHSVIRNDSTNVALAVNESILLHVDQANGPIAEVFPPDIGEKVASRLKRDSQQMPKIRVGNVAIRHKTDKP